MSKYCAMQGQPFLGGNLSFESSYVSNEPLLAIQSGRSLIYQVFVYLKCAATLNAYLQMLLVCLMIGDNKIYKID
jgi:hypothetical protein